MLLNFTSIILFLILFTTFKCNDVIITTLRHKRYVAFRKGSTFFYRLNYKVNTLPHSTVIAQASGFKVAWKLPVSRQAKESRTISISDIHEGARFLYESHGFNGKMCLLKSLCQATEYIKKKDGVLMKILNLLFGSDNRNRTLSLDPFVCRSYANHCPLYLIGFNAFTGY